MSSPELADSGAPSARGGLTAASLLALATAIGLVLDRHVSLTSLAMVYVLAVVIAAYRLGWVESAACAVGAVVALNFFFVSPRYTFEVDNRENLIALAAMLAVALVISRLAAGLRRETQAARLGERRARQLQRLATALAGAGSADEVLALGNSALAEARAGPDYLAFEGSEAGRQHAQALHTTLEQAMARQRLAASMRAAQEEAQHQQVQSTFLAAISHDLRTPLAAIVGAASSLLTQRDKLGAAEQERLLGSIAGEAAYLSTVTENTLQLVRLQSSAQGIRRDWESMEEIVGAVLARVRLHDAGRRITSKVPEGLPLVKADPVLIAQLLTNLLDNALKHTAGAIDLVVTGNPGELVVSVKDRGAGIPEAEQAGIFEPWARGDQAGPRGAGLGLALCRAIAQAHGGRLTLHQRHGGGSTFALTLPVDAQQPQADVP